MFKQILIAFFLCFCLTLCSRIASADQVAFKYGVGTLLPDQSSMSVKAFSISSQDYLGWGVTEQVELGVFSDIYGEGRESAGFGFYSLGATVDAEPFRLQALWGVGGITNPDNRLGGLLQFTYDMGLSLYNSHSNESIGVGYKHISSAGLSSPNRGRDFILMRIGFNF